MDWNKRARRELADVLGLDSTATEGIGEEIPTACYSIFSDLREGKKAAKSDAAGWSWVHNCGRELLNASMKCNECCGYWGTRKEKGLKQYLLNRV